MQFNILVILSIATAVMAGKAQKGLSCNGGKGVCNGSGGSCTATDGTGESFPGAFEECQSADEIAASEAAFDALFGGGGGNNNNNDN